VHKVLIYTATYGDGPRRETLDSVLALTFKGRVRREVGWHNPYGGGDMRNVLAQLQRSREMTIDGKYDALLTVEHDMRVPPDALQRLWDTGAPVAYGAYLFRHGAPVLNVLEAYIGGSRNIGESLQCNRRRLARARRQGVVECTGLGFGCTLIRREVLEAIRFRDLEKPGCVDMAFATDCLRAGIRQVADLRVMCAHWDGQEWLMPFAGERKAQVRALKNVRARSGRLTAGESYELPEGEALELARAGYVRIASAADGARTEPTRMSAVQGVA
jgi:hypothetical protein